MVGKIVTCLLLLQYEMPHRVFEQQAEVKCEVLREVRDPIDPDVGDSILLVDCSRHLKTQRLSNNPVYNDPIRHLVYEIDCF